MFYTKKYIKEIHRLYFKSYRIICQTRFILQLEWSELLLPSARTGSILSQIVKQEFQ